MNQGLDFGALRKDRSSRNVAKGTHSGTATPSQPTEKPTRNRTDWKKKYEETQTELDSWVKSAGERSRHMDKMAKELGVLRRCHTETVNELTELKTWADAVKKEEKENYELKDEIHRLKVQDAMSKKVIDKLTLEAEKYKFRPQQYSELSQLLISMRVRGNRAQKETVINIVGTTDIVEVRKYIFKLLEAPYK